MTLDIALLNDLGVSNSVIVDLTAQPAQFKKYYSQSHYSYEIHLRVKLSSVFLNFTQFQTKRVAGKNFSEMNVE